MDSDSDKQRKYKREYREANRDKINEYQRWWRAEHPEESRAHNRKSYQAHRNSKASYQRQRLEAIKADPELHAKYLQKVRKDHLTRYARRLEQRLTPILDHMGIPRANQPAIIQLHNDINRTRTEMRREAKGKPDVLTSDQIRQYHEYLDSDPQSANAYLNWCFETNRYRGIK